MTCGGTEAPIAGARLLTELRSEAARADSKASLLLGVMSMTVSLLVGLLAARGRFPLRLSVAGSALLWVALAALAGALVCLLLAVVPRYGNVQWAPGRPLTYFGDIRRATDDCRLAEALDVTEAHPTEGVLEALAQNSRIVGAKHRWIRVGLGAYCVGMLLLPIVRLVG